jgi:hypothetical protein
LLYLYVINLIIIKRRVFMASVLSSLVPSSVGEVVGYVAAAGLYVAGEFYREGPLAAKVQELWESAKEFVYPSGAGDYVITPLEEPEVLEVLDVLEGAAGSSGDRAVKETPTEVDVALGDGDVDVEGDGFVGKTRPRFVPFMAGPAGSAGQPLTGSVGDDGWVIDLMKKECPAGTGVFSFADISRAPPSRAPTPPSRAPTPPSRAPTPPPRAPTPPPRAPTPSLLKIDFSELMRAAREESRLGADFLQSLERDVDQEKDEYKERMGKVLLAKVAEQKAYNESMIQPVVKEIDELCAAETASKASLAKKKKRSGNYKRIACQLEKIKTSLDLKMLELTRKQRIAKEKMDDSLFDFGITVRHGGRCLLSDGEINEILQAAKKDLEFWVV